MKYADIHKVFQLSEEMEDLIKKRNRVEANNGGDSFLGVTLNGTYQQPEFVDEVRPAVVAALNKRIIQINDRLKQLGVEPGY